MPDPERMLTEADVALNPSDSEGGMPFALVEALLAAIRHASSLVAV